MIPDKLLEQIFIIFHQLTNSYGISIILLSLAVTIIMFPLFLFAEILQERERTRKRAMQPDLDEIKELNNKQEKYYYTKEIYKKNNYKSYYALTGLIGLAIQVPFFIAAYWMLLEYTPLQGVSFGPIKDLFRPDGLITIGETRINLLPFIMTIINLFAGYLHSKKMDRSEQIQLLMIASVFLVMLYNLSAALTIYWTMNNVFAIGKNWLISNINLKYHGLSFSIQTSKKQNIIHPFLFAIYPIIFLASHNIHEINLKEAFIPILIVLFISGSVKLFSKFLSFNMQKVGLILTISWILFFSFTHIIFLLYSLQSYELFDLRIRYMYILFFGIPFVTLLFFIIKTNKNLFKITTFLNILGIILIIIPLTNICYNIISFSINNYTYSDELFDSEINIEAEYPDIYYIVLDGYARADVLRDVFNYNNQPFLDKMKSIGFDVASQSYANYVQTSQSLPSSINMEYVHLKQRNFSKYSTQNNYLAKFLKKRGYLISEISNGWGPRTPILHNPDENYKVGPSMLSSFQITLVNSSPLFFLDDIILDNRISYDRVLDAFDWLTSMPKVSEPRFIFAHIISPHSPFLFGKNGEKRPSEKHFAGSSKMAWANFDKKAYVEQLIFINKKLEIAIQEILDHSTVPPIIIIQSDHGTASLLGSESTPRNWIKPNKAMIKERAANLVMCYLPCDESEGFYNSITPVNIFRVVFNTCFNSNLELLPDSLYWSWYKQDNVFTNFTDSLP